MGVTLRILAILFLFLFPLLGYGAIFVTEESEAAQVVGRDSIKKAIRDDRAHFQKTGVGLFYGSKSSYSPIKKLQSASDTMWSDIDRFSYIKTVLRKDFVHSLSSTTAIDSYVGSLVGNQDQLPRNGDLEMTSPVLWVLKHVKAAYTAAGKKERGEQIDRIVASSGDSPVVLIMELQKDGWHSIYWNPDVNTPAETDQGKKSLHERSWQEASRGEYMNGKIKVDYSLINYRPSHRSKTKKTISSLRKLKRVPFWIGMANYGKHVFAGYHGNLSEAYSMEMPTSPRLIMNSEFANWSGHYKSEKLLSGIIMVPPGSL